MSVTQIFTAISTFVSSIASILHPPLPQSYYRYGFGMTAAILDIVTPIGLFLATFIDFPYNPHQGQAVTDLAEQFYSQSSLTKALQAANSKLTMDQAFQLFQELIAYAGVLAG